MLKPLTVVLLLILPLCLIAQEKAAENNLPTKGLVAYYPFNGNTKDESGNGFHLTADGCELVQDRFTFGNKAYSFDGSVSRMMADIKGKFPVQQLTLSAWIYYRGGGAENPRIIAVSEGKTNIHTYSLIVNRDDGRLWFYTGTTGNDLHGNKRIIEKVWHHVAVTYDGREVRIYQDGILDQRTYVYFKLEPLRDGYLMISHSDKEGLLNDLFPGIIDDIRIYNQALDETEVHQLYHEGAWKQ
ncbi:MAG: LamG domain-containing protein [bacterium]